MAGFALSRTPFLSYALLGLAGASLMIVFALFMTLVQANVVSELVVDRLEAVEVHVQQRDRVDVPAAALDRGAQLVGELKPALFAMPAIQFPSSSFGRVSSDRSRRAWR